MVTMIMARNLEIPEIHKFEAMLKWAKNIIKKQGYQNKSDAKANFRACMDWLSRDLKLYRISPQVEALNVSILSCSNCRILSRLSSRLKLSRMNESWRRWCSRLTLECTESTIVTWKLARSVYRSRTQSSASGSLSTAPSSLRPSTPSKNRLTGFLLTVAECLQNSDVMYQTTPNDTCLGEVCFNCYHRCVSLIFGLKSGIPFFVK